MEIITVSEKARIRLQELLEEQKLDRETYFLRVGVKGGGCSGLSYELGFDNIPQEGDNIVETNSIKIAIDKNVIHVETGKSIKLIFLSVI